MKNFRIPYWVWILAAIAVLSTLRTCGILDRLLGLSGCVQIIYGVSEDNKSLLISQDGQKLAVTSDTEYVNILNPLDGSLINTIRFDLSGDINSVGISPDGNLFAVQNICGSLQILRTSDGKIIYERPWKYDGCANWFRGGASVGRIVFLPDSKHVAYVVTTEVIDIANSFIDLIITDLSNGKDTLHLTDHITDKSMKQISVSDNGKWISLLYEDRYELRTLSDFSLVETAQAKPRYQSLSPDGHFVETDLDSVFSKDGKLRADLSYACDTDIFSTKSERKILTLSQPGISLDDYVEVFHILPDATGYCSGASIVFTTDNKYVYYSYRNHILKWRLPEVP